MPSVAADTAIIHLMPVDPVEVIRSYLLAGILSSPAQRVAVPTTATGATAALWISSFLIKDLTDGSISRRHRPRRRCNGQEG